MGCKGTWKLVSLVNSGRNSFWRVFNLVCDIVCCVQLISEGRGLMESFDFLFHMTLFVDFVVVNILVECRFINHLVW